MKTYFFNSRYNYAKTVQIAKDDYFCTAGYFWLNLTQKQMDKMYDLMIQQGATPDENGRVYTENGIGIKHS